MTIFTIAIYKGRQCNGGRERLTSCQSEYPSPTTPTHWKKEEKEPGSPTPSNARSERSSHRDTERRIKVLRNFISRARSNQSTECIPHWNLRHRYRTMILYCFHNSAMLHSNIPTVYKQAPLTTQSRSLRCVSAVGHQTAEQFYKTCRTKPRKRVPRSNLIKYSPRVPQDSQPLRSYMLWKPSEDDSHKSAWIQISLPIYHSRHADYFNTVPPIVNGGDWGCIVRDL